MAACRFIAVEPSSRAVLPDLLVVAAHVVAARPWRAHPVGRAAVALAVDAARLSAIVAGRAAFDRGVGAHAIAIRQAIHATPRARVALLR